VFVLDRVMRLSVRWMAPETLSGIRKVFSERTDVWAFAVTCWEVYMYGRMPFKSLKTEVARDQIMQGKARLTSRPPTTCPTPVWDVLVRCWDYSPKQRPSFKGASNEGNSREHFGAHLPELGANPVPHDLNPRL
jgi:serine/threonine protein kinase